MQSVKIFSAGLALAVFGSVALAECSSTLVDLRWDTGSARFNVEIADDVEERAKGLMFRETMARYDGMLFIYETPIAANFWMKNTLIPLDMIFLDQHGVVQSIHENAVPGNLETIPGGEQILAVLEVNGGLTQKLGISVGAVMRHPAFTNYTPQWPCN
jgi:uncharacterized membrane protein (UPF0127 family)